MEICFSISMSSPNFQNNCSTSLEKELLLEQNIPTNCAWCPQSIFLLIYGIYIRLSYRDRSKFSKSRFVARKKISKVGSGFVCK